jgi:hypothetical protein
MSMRIVPLVLFLVCAWAPRTQANLIINGDAETGDTTGWVTTGVHVVPSSLAGTMGLPPGVSIGNFSFAGGTDPASSQSLTQTVDVSSFAALIDAGEIESIFSALLRSRSDGTAVDTVTATLTYSSAAGAALATVAFSDTSIVPNEPDWDAVYDQRLVPVGTRSITVRFDTFRSGGTSTDAFFDNVALDLRPAAVPEPSSIVLAGLGRFCSVPPPCGDDGHVQSKRGHSELSTRAGA